MKDAVADDSTNVLPMKFFKTGMSAEAIIFRLKKVNFSRHGLRGRNQSKRFPVSLIHLIIF